MDLLTIGERIAVERKARGLTQTQLAEKSKSSRATISALETGTQRELGFNKLMCILAQLGLDLRITEGSHRRPTLEELQEENRRSESGAV